MFEKLLKTAFRTRIWLLGQYTKEMEREDDLAVLNRKALLESRFSSIFPKRIINEDEDLHG